MSRCIVFFLRCTRCYVVPKTYLDNRSSVFWIRCQAPQVFYYTKGTHICNFSNWKGFLSCEIVWKDFLERRGVLSHKKNTWAMFEIGAPNSDWLAVEQLVLWLVDQQPSLAKITWSQLITVARSLRKCRSRVSLCFYSFLLLNHPRCPWKLPSTSLGAFWSTWDGIKMK